MMIVLMKLLIRRLKTDFGEVNELCEDAGLSIEELRASNGHIMCV